MNTSPNRHDWHRRPVGHSGKSCPVCEAPRHIFGMHRATREDEPVNARFQVQRKGGVVVDYLRRNNHRRRDTKEQRIAKATRLVAQGLSYAEVGRQLGVSETTVQNWSTKDKALWTLLLDQATQEVVELLRLQAGTDAVLDDIDGYYARAQHAQRWCEQRGERLFDRGGQLTLRKFYDQHYKPIRLADSSAGTLKWHNYLLRQWEVFTGDPPLDKIAFKTLARFRDCLRRRPGRRGEPKLSVNTVRNYMAFIQGLLDRAGPPRIGCRDAADILDRVPWVKPLRPLYRVVREVPLRHLDAVYRAADGMTSPTTEGLDAPAWWRLLVVLAYNLGLRKGSLFAMRMDWIAWRERYIAIPPDVSNKTGQGQQIHLTATAMRHLEATRTNRERVLPWEFTAKKTFYFHWRKLLGLAGIPEPEWFGLHAIRKTLSTQLWDVAPHAAQLTMGHTRPDTTRRFYVARSRIVSRALEQIPQPECFGATKEGGDP